MREKILNKWLPISQFPYSENDSGASKGQKDTWTPNKILLYGEAANHLTKQAPQIWYLDALYGDDGKLHFAAETFLRGRWIEVIPTMYMEVTLPSEQEIQHATSS